MKQPKCFKCDEFFPIKRWELGYNTCLTCGQSVAKQVKFCVVPMHKSNYVVVSNKEELKGINNKTQ